MADLDRLLREQNPEPGQPRIPVPQYQKIDGLGYEKVTGQHGGAHAVLLSPDGQPINSGNRLPVDTGLTNNLQIIADNQGRLYGSPDGGSTWKAVKVNSGGQLELAQNVVIDNVTVNVGAEVKVNNTPEDPVNVQLSGTLVSYQGVLDITAGSSVSVLEQKVAKGTIKKIMVRSGNATTYSIKLRHFAMSYTPYAEEIIAENRAGSQGFQLYEVDIVVPRYTLILQNTGVADFYGYWSITEVL